MPVRASPRKEKFDGEDTPGHLAPQAVVGMMDRPDRNVSDY